jgi:hypothetical protein
MPGSADPAVAIGLIDGRWGATFGEHFQVTL